MSFFASLITDPAKASRLLQMLLLLPLVIPYVNVAEKSGKSDPEKKKAVLAHVSTTTDKLERAGFISKEINTGLDKIASELVDIVVDAFKADKKEGVKK